MRKHIVKDLALGCLATGGLVVLGILGLWYLAPRRPTPPDYRTTAREGQPIVQAILEFRQQNGVWPRTLDELVPGYLATLPPAEWMWHFPSLLHPVDMPHTGIHYNFIPPDAGWASEGDFGQGAMALAAPTTTRPAPTPAQQFKNAIAILDGRIARAPAEILNYQDKVVFLVHQKKTGDAWSVARQGVDRFPNEWWFRMAAAELGEGEAKKTAEAEFATWAGGRANFNDGWYLATYYRRRGQNDQAIKALEDAAKQPVFHSRRSDSAVPEYFCFDAAAFACKLQKYDLTLKICDQWDRLTRAQGYGMDDRAILRAAACLGLGRVAEARTLLGGAKPNGWCEDVPRLKAAVDGGDSTFVYDGDARSRFPFSLFEARGLDE